MTNFRTMNEINKMIGKNYSNYTWVELMEAINFIENIDSKDKYYQWEGIDGGIEYNFESYQVETDFNKCYIWLNLRLDPPQMITSSKLSTKFDSTLDAVNQFATMFNKGEL